MKQYTELLLEKKCSKCQIVKPTIDYHRDNRNKVHGCMDRCKICSSKIGHFKDKSPEFKLKQYFYNKEKRSFDIFIYNKYQNNYFHSRDICYKLLKRAKANAKKRNLEINIGLEDIVVPEYCPYLDFKLIRGNKNEINTNSSIDRIDSTKGYIKGNVQIISMLANRMKNSATLEELLIFSKNVLLQNKDHEIVKKLLEILNNEK